MFLIFTISESLSFTPSITAEEADIEKISAVFSFSALKFVAETQSSQLFPQPPL